MGGLPIDVLVIAVCAVIACAEGWDDIALYGRSKLAWLRTFLELPNGIPSHDTFRRVFMLIDPKASRPSLLGPGRLGLYGRSASFCPDSLLGLPQPDLEVGPVRLPVRPLGAPRLPDLPRESGSLPQPSLR
jgi:hypothetical protein